MPVNAIAPMTGLGNLSGFDEGPETSLPSCDSLTRKQKAALIVRLLAADGVKLPLSDLSEDHQTELTEQVGRLRLVDRETLAAVVEEFCDALEAVGVAFPGGLDGALTLLDGQISPAATSRLRRLAAGKSRADPWERIAGLPTEVLLPVIAEESTEVGAVMLSKISVAKAAELLGQLPGDKARRVAYAVSLTGNVAPETVLRIGQALAGQLDAQPPKAFDSGPVERVGAILNSAPSATRDSVLQGLEEEDSAFAEEVRKAIFTFANIPARIDPRDIPKILRKVDQARMVTALAAAKGPLEPSREFILSNISQRMAQTLREEIENLGKVKEKDAEEALSEVVAAIREMEAAGEIVLTAEDEE